MKKSFILVLCFIMLLSMVSCKSHGPDSMSKCANSEYELYRFDDANGILIYTKNEQKYVFDICFKYGNYLYVYEHRENEADAVEMLAEYTGLVSLIPNKCKYSLTRICDSSYEDIFKSRITLKIKQRDISFEDVPYKFVYGDPVKQNVSCLECHENGADIKLHITEDVEGSYMEIIYDNSNIVTTFDVNFDMQGKMTLISRDNNGIRAQYYIRQRCDEYIAKIVTDTQKLHNLPTIIYFDNCSIRK